MEQQRLYDYGQDKLDQLLSKDRRPAYEPEPSSPQPAPVAGKSGEWHRSQARATAKRKQRNRVKA